MNPQTKLLILAAMLMTRISPNTLQADKPTRGVRLVTVLNYENCLELFNESTCVQLGWQVGGRVLQYTYKGKEALYLSPEEADWRETDHKTASAGRFDIGPEYLVPPRPTLWEQPWHYEILGPRAARLTSNPDPSTGVTLIRDFQLAETSSHLECRQTIYNHSKSPKAYCHWSRTFAHHGGIAIIPLTPTLSKLPDGYVMYKGRGLVDFRPSDPMIRRQGDYLILDGPAKQPKLGFDSMKGWFTYLMPNDLAFTKRYETFPERLYHDTAGLSISIWYPEASHIPACELEPIGPLERLAPGESASFSEHWELTEFPFPKDPSAIDAEAVANRLAP